jgi:hypothetical protein
MEEGLLGTRVQVGQVLVEGLWTDAMGVEIERQEGNFESESSRSM